MEDSKTLLKRIRNRRDYVKHRDAYLQRAKNRRNGLHRNEILQYQEQYRKEKRRYRIPPNKEYFMGAKCWINLQRRVTFQRAREELYHMLNQYSCQRCGITDKRVLEFDHINGGGTKEHKHVFKNKRLQFYMYYALNPEVARRTLQVLCANCNRIRIFESRSV
jgi:hypothetical protein